MFLSLPWVWRMSKPGSRAPCSISQSQQVGKAEQLMEKGAQEKLLRAQSRELQSQQPSGSDAVALGNLHSSPQINNSSGNVENELGKF